MTCPHCGQPVPSDGRFCPFCGAPLAAPAETGLPGTVFHCPTCGEAALPEARYCAACGRELPSVAAEAAEAAEAVSSSGRDDGTDPRSRAVFLAEVAHDAALARMPQRSGDLLADLSAAEVAAAMAEREWEGLDSEWRAAGGANPEPWADPADLADLRRLKQRADAAWTARQAVVAHRDRLERAVYDISPERDAAAQRRAADQVSDLRRRMER